MHRARDRPKLTQYINRTANKEEKAMFTRTIKKAWYKVPRIEFIDGKAEIVYDEVETWFPESWEKKNAKSNFIKKTK